ncbi:MAG: serine hydrolase domain-containing protein [Bacteroidota bacterium]
MKKILFFVSTNLFLPFLLLGQSTVFQNIDVYLKDYQEKIPIPGFSIAIVQDGEVVFSKGYGVEKQGTSQAMTTQSSLGIGGLTQAFTAVGILQLVEQGLVDLDAPVVAYLPWFQTANKNFSDQITVRMCLSHTSAIPAQYEAVPSLNPDDALPQFVRSLEGYYVKRKPGLSYETSAEGFSIAGLIISEISEMSYADYVQQKIFEPLQMNRTTTRPQDFDRLGVLYGHEIGLTQFVPAQKEVVDGNFFPSGSAMKSSVSDYANFMRMLLNDGKFAGKTFLQPESISEIFTSNISFQGLGTMLGGNGIDIQCGLGWLEMDIEDRTIYINTGTTGTTAAIAGLSRTNNQGVAVFFNGDVNRLNRFVYPTLENTANNVIHILNNEATTDFAVTRFEDPFDDIIEIPKEKRQRYLGRYYPTGRENPFFKDRQLEIFEGPDGVMELKATKDGILKGHFKLQFSSESRSVLRSITQPREIQFQILPNGSIGGLFMYGTQFKKRPAELLERFRTVEISSEGFTGNFLFPKSGTFNSNASNFQGSISKASPIQITGSMRTLTDNTLDELVANHLAGQNITTRGNQLKKSLKDGIWTEQTVFTQRENQTLQHLFILYKDPVSQREVSFVLEGTFGHFDASVQEAVRYIQQSVVFSSIGE